MVIRRKINLPIHQVDQQAGDSPRVYRPTRYDVLFGRGIVINDHPGNVRLRRLISRYIKRYTGSGKNPNLITAEVIFRRVKRGGKGQSRARFLRRVEPENYWEEVDDRIAFVKVRTTLNRFLRKLREGHEILVSDVDDDSSVGEEESDTERVLPPCVPQESNHLSSISSILSPKVLEKCAAGVDVLKRLSPIHARLGPRVPLSGAVNPLVASGMLPAPSGSLKFGASGDLTGILPRLAITPMPAGMSGAFAGLPLSAAVEAELDYCMNLRCMSSRLMDLALVERAQRNGGGLLPLVDPRANSLTFSALAIARMEQQLLQQRLLNQTRMQQLLTKGTNNGA